MTHTAERPHIKYGSAILIRSELKVKGVSVCEQDNVDLISIEMPGVVVHSVYKLPNEKVVLEALRHENLPHIVIADFNSHSTTSEYTTTDDNGEAVEQWADCSSTVQDGRDATAPTLSSCLGALLTSVENQSWNLSLTRNIAQVVHVKTR